MTLPACSENSNDDPMPYDSCGSIMWRSPMPVTGKLVDITPASTLGAEAAVLSVSSLKKCFLSTHVNPVKAIDDITLDVHKGEMVVLLGPSGCGKTTLLRCVAGLESPDTGRITIGNKLVFSDQRRVNVPTQHRALSMMFQSYALWPHMTTFDNVAYPLRTKSVPEQTIRQRVTGILEIAGVGHLIHEFPSRMSGGQQQRVALARALVAESQLILFDEPLSNVDAKVRESLRNEIAMMQRKFKFAGLYVTHDQKEALGLADRIAAIETGRVVQIGTPETLYSEPCSAYVANLLGAINHLRGVVRDRDGDIASVETEIGMARGRVNFASTDIRSGSRVTILFRPEAARLANLHDEHVPEDNEWTGAWESRVFSGSHVEEFVRINENVRLCAWGPPHQATPNTGVKYRVPHTAVRVIADPPLGGGTEAPDGNEV